MPPSTTTRKSAGTRRWKTNWSVAICRTATPCSHTPNSFPCGSWATKEILLLHANQLEADHIGELLELMRKRGYRFVTLEEALADPAYSLPDTYVGEDGTGWLDHWGIT